MTILLIGLCIMLTGLTLLYAWAARQYRTLCNEDIEAVKRWSVRCSKWRRKYYALHAKLLDIAISDGENDDDSDEDSKEASA